MATATTEAASGSTGGTPLGSPNPEKTPLLLRKFQEFMPEVNQQWKTYEDALVQKAKEGLMIASEYPLETCGVAVVAGCVLLRGPRRFLVRNTFGRFQTEKDRIAKLQSHLKELEDSVGELNKRSKNVLTRTRHAEEDLENGRTKIRNAGNEVQRLVNSINKIETKAADLMDELRVIPGGDMLKLRAEVASMASDLKSKRLELNANILKVAELGIRL